MATQIGGGPLPCALDGVRGGLEHSVGVSQVHLATECEAAAAGGVVVGVGLDRIRDAQDGLPQLLHAITYSVLNQKNLKNKHRVGGKVGTKLT